MTLDLKQLAGMRGVFQVRATVGWPIADVSYGSTSVQYEVTKGGEIKIVSVLNEGGDVTGILHEAVLEDFKDLARRHAAQELQRREDLKRQGK